jgi:cation:H+ antiporter
MPPSAASFFAASLPPRQELTVASGHRQAGMDIALACAAVVLGLVLLTLGADRLILAACALARRAKVSEAVIGATIVAGGTSMPELVASISGALSGQYGLAVGNVVGSNSFNVGAILGPVALIAPLAVAPVIARRDWTVMAVVSAICVGAALAFGAFPRWLCAGFLAAWVGYVVWAVRHGGEEAAAEDAPERPLGLAAAIGWSLVGMALLTAGGKALVWGAVGLASSAGISDAVIGLTIVAAGTSAPELVTSLVAARRGMHQIAVANIVGSNTFNILLILGVTGLFGTLPVADEILRRDLWWMLGFALVLPLLWWRNLRLGRTAGAILLGGYLLYLGILLADALA